MDYGRILAKVFNQEFYQSRYFCHACRKWKKRDKFNYINPKSYQDKIPREELTYEEMLEDKKRTHLAKYTPRAICKKCQERENTLDKLFIPIHGNVSKALFRSTRIFKSKMIVMES